MYEDMSQGHVKKISERWRSSSPPSSSDGWVRPGRLAEMMNKTAEQEYLAYMYVL